MQIEPQPTLDEVKAWEPTRIREWVSLLADRDEATLKHLNWLGLAEYTEAQAFDKAGTNEVSLDWLRAASAVRDYIAATAPSNYRGSAEVSAMMVRARAIRQLGPNHREAVLDPSVIQVWFESRLEIPLVEAQSSGRRWRALGGEARKNALVGERERLRQLRAIKNRLAVIAELARNGKVQLNANLTAWLNVRDQLP